MALLSHLGTSSLGSKSSWLVLSLLFGCADAVCPLPPVTEGAKLTTITHDGVSRSWYTYVPASVANAQAAVPRARRCEQLNLRFPKHP